MLWLALTATLLIAAWLIYPGELSWLPGKGNRWLYNRGARQYHQKWQRHDYQSYDNAIKTAASSAAENTEHVAVLDLACGSGRATTAAVAALGKRAHYTAVDYSKAMLQHFHATLQVQARHCDLELEIIEAEVVSWLQGTYAQYDLVMLMEAAEFIPDNRALIAALGTATRAGGQLVMTRPAGYWAHCFPGRRQQRHAVKQALTSAGFEHIRFSPWRARYELVQAVRSN